MKHFKILSLILLTLASGCSHTKINPNKETTPSTLESNFPQVNTKPDGVVSKIITLKCDSTCTDSEKKEVVKIEKAMNQVLNSDCLKQYITDPTRRLDNTNNLSRDKILEKLKTPTALTLNYYYNRYTKALGYESASDYSVMHFNRAKLYGWSVCDKASLGLHEFSHTKGFYHNGNLADPNYYTVPYQLNHATESKEYDSYNGGCCLEPAE